MTRYAKRSSFNKRTGEANEIENTFIQALKKNEPNTEEKEYRFSVNCPFLISQKFTNQCKRVNALV